MSFEWTENESRKSTATGTGIAAQARFAGQLGDPLQGLKGSCPKNRGQQQRFWVHFRTSCKPHLTVTQRLLGMLPFPYIFRTEIHDNISSGQLKFGRTPSLLRLRVPAPRRQLTIVSRLLSRKRHASFVSVALLRLPINIPITSFLEVHELQKVSCSLIKLIHKHRSYI